MAFQHIPGGVGLVTGVVGGDRFASTAVSVAPLSAAPPMLLVCLDRRCMGRRGDLADLRRFGVSILGAQHRTLAERFLARERQDDDALAAHGGWRTLGQDARVIDDATLAFDCRVDEVIDRDGRAIVIGEVEAMRAGQASSALVYWRGDYDRIGWTEAEIACATGTRRP